MAKASHFFQASFSKQKGQAIVYVLVFTPIILLSLLLLYNSGKLTDEKMKIQNAADATAYSISLLEARDLNFTAYTNRAMIGNEIAIAQLVGLYSWFDMLSSNLEFFEYYVLKPLDAFVAPSLGTITPVVATLRAMKIAMQIGINSIKDGIKIVGKAATKAVAAINLAYSYAQRGMHYATVLLTLSVLDKIIGDNAPGAKLSDFGFFSLAAHMGTYYANPLTDATFVRHNESSEVDDLGLLMRQQYAATVNGSRDDFSLDRDGGFSFVMFAMPEVSVTVDLLLLRGNASFDAGIDLLRRGGTDLRYRESSDEQHYSWSGVDLIGMDFWFALQVFSEVFVPLSGWETLFDIDIEPHVDVPLGIGTGQLASRKGVLKANNMTGVEGEEYGNAPGDLPVTYNFPGPVPDFGVPLNISSPDSLIYHNHKGLPPFNSVVPLEIMSELASKHPSLSFVEDINFFAPYLIIGLVKESDNIRTSEDIINSDPSTRLHLDNELQDGEMAAIAKSEVYFSRPTDELASHFSRLDGATEYGSTYNPFWQARLVDTQIPERVIALLFQQKQIWALSGVTLALPFGLGDFDLNKMLNDMGLI